MISKLTILFFSAALFAGAQTADQWFNQTAREYIYRNTEEASNLVHRALANYPDDEKLQKLKKLIEEQQEQQQQQQQNQDQNQDQQNQEQSDSSDQQNENQPEQENSEPEQNQEQENEPAEPQEAEQRQPGELSEEEALQLLDAMKQNEQDRRANLHPYLGPPVQVEKDW